MAFPTLAKAYGGNPQKFNLLIGFVFLFSALFTVSTAKAETVLLALGDSLTAGYGLSQQHSFPSQLQKALHAKGKKVKVVNGGVSGDTTAGGLSRVGWLMAENPDAVIISLGGNDGLRGLSADQTRENLEKIIIQFKKARIPVLVAGMMAPPNLGRDYAEKFNNVFGKTAQKYRTIFYPFFLKDVAGRSVLNQSDGIHPNEEGVQIIVKNILPYVEKLLSQVK